MQYFKGTYQSSCVFAGHVYFPVLETVHLEDDAHSAMDQTRYPRAIAYSYEKSPIFESMIYLQDGDVPDVKRC